jgi:nucleotidyltransferase substrate binding protein (TIGR01987 family)
VIILNPLAFFSHKLPVIWKFFRIPHIIQFMPEDIRWRQRFQNYKKALTTITNAVEAASSRELNDLEKQGLIQGFEFTFELAWNVMKDYLEEQGITGIIGSKNAIRYAFNKGLIEDGQIWMDMVKGRNISSHSYDEEMSEELVHSIINNFYTSFIAFKRKMDMLEE